MKILHVILTDQFYGSERYCAELAALQAARGHRVKLLLQNVSASYVDEFRATVAADGAFAAATPSASSAPPAELVTIPGWLPAPLHRPFAWRILAGFSPDIVHTHLDPAARRVGKRAERAGILHVATLHLDYHRREHGGCDGVICVAEWQRASIGPDFSGTQKLVRNWLPVRVTQALAATSSDATAALRRTWNAGQATTVFGSVGRLLPEKSMDVLTEAFRQAFPRGDENVRLVLVGDGLQRRNIAQHANGDARIVLAGWRADVAAHYRAFDVYVSAATFEPFGLSILEAMAAGCRLILTRTQGPSEFVHDPRVHWCATGEAAPLANLMRKEIAGPRGRHEYDLTAFSPALAVTAIEGLYRDMIARRQATIRAN